MGTTIRGSMRVSPYRSGETSSKQEEAEVPIFGWKAHYWEPIEKLLA